MSISVKNVVKTYGSQLALDQVSFEINRGEIVGFLGPNGAGKSTMMKIITCFLPQNKGEVLVSGLNVIHDSLEIKRIIGYLPEHNPLYPDMYVKEYLGFMCGIHKIKNQKKSIAEIIEQVGLGPEQSKKIGALSKGYKQRVGLAQALIHKPEVLILDEPTTGLDPNQIIEIRNVIKEVGKERTVMITTHIMQEVEAICDKVIIIKKGRIVADDKNKALQLNKSNEKVVQVEFSGTPEMVELSRLQGVIRAEKIQSNKWLISSEKSINIQEVLFKFAVEKSMIIKEIQEHEKSMEDVFRELTT